MATTLFDRTIAFAGICQAIKLIQGVARSGCCEHSALRISLNSIIVTNPASAFEVFGKEENLKLGLRTLINELDSRISSSELTRYLINILALERKLSGRRDSLAQLGNHLETVQRQIQHIDLLTDQMISNLASIYLEIITPLGPRIQVTGIPAQLQQIDIQHKIRALLLSGIRSAVLWHQVGGKYRHLIFGRKKMIEHAKIILTRNL
ncbi:high frequency lysogenization protein HflD [Candidatus Enterovibrio escicola]|uniref:high frequency lysogenization protein HflD n=1 Tax=Candidatus Enterovibrio escicola TaxID=1927127 RepID=UPI0012383444|nr:high frequency lysogenization protein HflD [Candidatus Enterovibrio escacola]